MFPSLTVREALEVFWFCFSCRQTDVSQMFVCLGHMTRSHHIPLNRELRESPEWLLLRVDGSVGILGKAGSLSIFWLDPAISLMDQEIPEKPIPRSYPCSQSQSRTPPLRWLTANWLSTPADLLRVIIIIVIFLHQLPNAVNRLLWLLQLSQHSPDSTNFIHPHFSNTTETHNPHQSTFT